MDEVTTKRHVSLYSLNLLWTVPLAIAIGYFPGAIVRFQRCGIQNCLGEVDGFASQYAPDAVGVAILAALAMFAALALTPWLRPLWLRLLISLAVAVFVLVFYVRHILF